MFVTNVRSDQEGFSYLGDKEEEFIDTFKGGFYIPKY